MKKFSFFLAFALAAVFIYAAGVSSASSVTFPEALSGFDTKQTGESGVYNFDKNHSFIGFKVKHMGLIEVPGFFGCLGFFGSLRCLSRLPMTSPGVSPRDRRLRARISACPAGVAPARPATRSW